MSKLRPLVARWRVIFAILDDVSGPVTEFGNDRTEMALGSAQNEGIKVELRKQNVFFLAQNSEHFLVLLRTRCNHAKIA